MEPLLAEKWGDLTGLNLEPITQDTIDQLIALDAAGLIDFELPLKGQRFNISRVWVGQKVVFEADPKNKYDSQAVKVLNEKGYLLGHLPKGMGLPGTTRGVVTKVGRQGETLDKGEAWTALDFTWIRPVFQ